MLKKIKCIMIGLFFALCFIGCKAESDDEKLAQGDVVKESWMNSTSGNLMIDDGTGTSVEIAKSSEVVVVLSGTVAEVAKTDDSSWSGYIEEDADADWKGVFLKDRKVKLSPFVMGQYAVTNQLYAQVMGETATTSVMPIDKITWYEACAFCNELTKKTFGKTTDQCVYYNDEGNVYSISDATNEKDVVIADKSYNTTTHEWIKMGYRMPTEAEWEFAARGGDPNVKDASENYIWNYAYSGIDSSEMVKDSTKAGEANYDSEGCLIKDDNLNNYAVYCFNDDDRTDVGTKKPNRLNLYDMSGNIWEWCYDTYDEDVTKNDDKDSSGNVINPLGASIGTDRIKRGGCCWYKAYCNCVSYRKSSSADNVDDDNGFRIVRSIK